MMQHILKVQNVHKEFGGISAVNNCSFAIEQGSIVGLIGPNGAGKTTMFDLICGFVNSNKGDIMFKNKGIINRKPDKISNMGISRTFQIIRLFDKMTALENIISAIPDQNEKIWHALLQLSSMKKLEKVNREKAVFLLKFVGLYEKREEIAMNLSYGQQKLLEIARALASDPDLLMLDEPAAGVNLTMLKKIKKTIFDLKKQGKTIFLVEHNMDFVMEMCDKVIVLDHGSEIATGNPWQIQKNKKVLDAYLGGVEEINVKTKKERDFATAMPIIRIKKLNAAYANVQILFDVDISIKQGEIVSIIGPNGAGKSTVLKSIFGLVNKRSGKIFFNKKNILKKDSFEIVKLGISFVPQGRSVFPNLSVFENLELGAYIRTDEFSKDIKKMFDMFPILKKKKNQKAGLLSGGEQQMLSIARGLMTHPSVLLLDEPSLGLSPRIRKQIFEKILEINRQGVTIIMVEQNARLALSISDKAYVLELGRNKYYGKGKALLNDQKISRLYLGGD